MVTSQSVSESGEWYSDQQLSLSLSLLYAYIIDEVRDPCTGVTTVPTE